MSVDHHAGPGRVKVVKRNLFGTAAGDHEQIRDDLNREMSRILEEKKRKWNFDFENFQPLPGRYKWERVGKRLQTRKSPTGPTCTTSESTENACRQRAVDAAHSTARYNLRTRDRELENISVFDFKPIEPARKRLRELGATPVENRATGHCENQRDAKERKAKTTTVVSHSTVQRRSKPRPLEKKARR